MPPPLPPLSPLLSSLLPLSPLQDYICRLEAASKGLSHHTAISLASTLISKHFDLNTYSKYVPVSDRLSMLSTQAPPPPMCAGCSHWEVAGLPEGHSVAAI